ncbi:MAG: 50S ribosomal protein L23 [Bacteroidales bacterium]|jgi:large subunit ribosomal protein L23|nr:50S ribosomal protein L23 [Bacteroidales bacterium]NLM91791.1 50S ribosomal protein L23 [Bacteroidales bacterium]
MEVLIKPLITEKMTAVTEKFPTRFGFIVDKRASKNQIKAAVEEMYDVEVATVNTMVYLGKRKTRFTKTGIQSGRKNSFKKAIITLAEGQTIDFYSNI